MKVFGHHVYPPILLLAIVEFLLATIVFATAILATVYGAEPGSRLLLDAMIYAGAVSIGLTSVGLYQTKQRVTVEGVLARIVVGLGIAVICLALLNFVFALDLGRWATGIGLAIVMVVLGLDRLMLSRWVDHELFQRRILIYGAGTRAASLAKLRRASDRRGFKIIGFVPAEGDSGAVDEKQIIKGIGRLHAYVQAEKVDEVVVAMDDRRRGFPVSELLACKFAGVDVVDLLAFLERETGKIKVDLANPSWFIFSEGLGARMRSHLATRALDLVTALILIVLAAPLMVAVALAIVLDSGLPVFYRQQRVGLAGKIFTLYKFRSMVANAEADGQAKWASTSDSRVTRVGGVLRKLRLDELPQLLNVIRGDMSLVGPRPERPEFVAGLSSKIPYYHERHSVKPGITGWAQLCYPYGSSEHDALEKLQFDLYYIKHKSLIFDLMVLLQTAEVVLWGKGAR